MSSSSVSKSSISFFSSFSRFEEFFSFRSSQSYRGISASVFDSMKNREISNFDEFYDRSFAWFFQNARIKKQDDVEQITNWVSQNNRHQERVKSSSSQWLDYDRFSARRHNITSLSSVRRLNRNERTIRYYFDVDERRYQFRDESVSSSSSTHDRQRTQVKDH